METLGMFALSVLGTLFYAYITFIVVSLLNNVSRILGFLVGIIAVYGWFEIVFS